MSRPHDYDGTSAGQDYMTWPWLMNDGSSTLCFLDFAPEPPLKKDKVEPDAPQAKPETADQKKPHETTVQPKLEAPTQPKPEAANAPQWIVTSEVDLKVPQERRTTNPSVLYHRFYEARQGQDFYKTYDNALQFVEAFERRKNFDSNDPNYRATARWLATTGVHTLFEQSRSTRDTSSSLQGWKDTIELANYTKKFDSFLSEDEKKFRDEATLRAARNQFDLERNSNVVIKTGDWVATNTIPTKDQVAERVAAACGFSKQDMVNFAKANHESNPSDYFFDFVSSGNSKMQMAEWVSEMRQNQQDSAHIWELKSGQIAYAQQWLKLNKEAQAELAQTMSDLRTSTDPNQRENLERRATDLRRQISGDSPLIKRDEFDEENIIRQNVIAMKRGFARGLNDIGEPIDIVTRPFQCLSTLVAGTQRGIGTGIGALAEKGSELLTGHGIGLDANYDDLGKYSPDKILEAAYHRFKTGEVPKGYEQPVALFEQLVAEHYGIDTNSTGHKVFNTILDMGFDPVSWGLAETVALRAAGRLSNSKFAELLRLQRVAKGERAAAETAEVARHTAGAANPSGTLDNAAVTSHPGAAIDDAAAQAPRYQTMEGPQGERGPLRAPNDPDAQRMIREAAEQTDRANERAAAQAAERPAADSQVKDTPSVVDDSRAGGQRHDAKPLETPQDAEAQRLIRESAPESPAGPASTPDATIVERQAADQPIDSARTLEYRPGDGPDVCANPDSVRQSNRYRKGGEISEPLSDGFQSVPDGAVVGADGNFHSGFAPSIVIDRSRDGVLRAVIQEAKARFGNITDPQKLADALSKFSKEKLMPKNWNERAVSNAYEAFSRNHQGERILIGDYIKQAEQGTGAGVCKHQAILFKVLADEMGLEASVTRGVHGVKPTRQSDMWSNHAWNEVRTSDGVKLYDPRAEKYGLPLETPRYHNMRDLPFDGNSRPLKMQQLGGYKPGEVIRDGEFKGFTISSETSKNPGDVVLRANGGRDISIDEFQRLNPGAALEVGQPYRIMRSDGRSEIGWIYTGTTKDGLHFSRSGSIRREVPASRIGGTPETPVAHPIDSPPLVAPPRENLGRTPIVDAQPELTGYTYAARDPVSGRGIYYKERHGEGFCQVMTRQTPDELARNYEQISLNGRTYFINKERTGIYSAHRNSQGNFEVWREHEYMVVNGSVFDY